MCYLLGCVCDRDWIRIFTLYDTSIQILEPRKEQRSALGLKGVNSMPLNYNITHCAYSRTRHLTARVRSSESEIKIQNAISKAKDDFEDQHEQSHPHYYVDSLCEQLHIKNYMMHPLFLALGASDNLSISILETKRDGMVHLAAAATIAAERLDKIIAHRKSLN